MMMRQLVGRVWRPAAAALLVLVAFGLTGLGFGLTFLRQEPGTPLVATVGFLLWGLAALAGIAAARLSKGA